MKEIRNSRGHLVKMVLNEKEWKRFTDFDPEAAKKRDAYIAKIKKERNFRRLPDGSVVGNFEGTLD